MDDSIIEREKDNRPKGIGFFNIKSGEVHYARLEAQIQAYINSSDLGINASRGQDFGWRLAPEWVKKVREFRRNETKMEVLSARNGGQKVTTTQVLYAIYGEQLRAAQERAEANENPFEEEYLRQINDRAESAAPSDADNFDALYGDSDEGPTELVADTNTPSADTKPADGVPTKKPAKQKSQ